MRNAVFIIVLLLLAVSCAARVITVDDDNPADFNNLQDALAMAASGDEIRVAVGIYRPDQGAGITVGDRQTTLQLKSGVAIYGGYPNGGAGWDERDPNVYKTVLSGDLLENDADVNDLVGLSYEATRADNSYHVLTAICTDSSAILYGFTITGGNASAEESSDPNSVGAGLYCKCGGPTLLNCTFADNSARWEGAAIYNLNSTTSIRRCLFVKNASGTIGTGYAGAVYVAGHRTVHFDECHFKENRSGQGGAIEALCADLAISSCTFTGNSANFGAALQMKDCHEALLDRCTFTHNSARRGAAAEFINSSPLITNCLFVHNSADTYGGAIRVSNSSTPQILNSTFASNSAQQGRSVACDSHENRPNYVDITNCILWNGGDEIANEDASTITISYSNVRGGWPGVGNIDMDPCFVDPGYWDPNGTPDDSSDDFWVDGDYHLKSEGWRWDSVRQRWDYNEVTSRCIDAGDPNSDWSAELWPHGKRINMGAYGGTPQASMSLSPIGNKADLNNDDAVDLLDFSYFADRWDDRDVLLRQDLNRNGWVNAIDLAIFAKNWLWRE